MFMRYVLMNDHEVYHIYECNRYDVYFE